MEKLQYVKVLDGLLFAKGSVTVKCHLIISKKYIINPKKQFKEAFCVVKLLNKIIV